MNRLNTVSSQGKKIIVYKREANNRLTKINVSFCSSNVKHSAGFQIRLLQFTEMTSEQIQDCQIIPY